jgi:Arc/MetJ-type ribon-helix-helix transcriptional regulator
MPEIRVTITKKMNKLLEKVVETGLFTSEADLVRFGTIDPTLRTYS